MEKLRLRSETAMKALRTLEEIVDEPYSTIVRDASIKRFEYSFDIFWKVIKDYLRIKEGIECASPKSCFREAFKVGILSEEETVKVLEMTDDRNLSTHTYDEETIEEIYQQVRDYWELMDNICKRIESSKNH
ncbi:nucleotidyltransferase substrate binding protein, HI0074 family [Methanosarcina barkeri 3]|uniref:Nucleotidyltransferase substrate binding protein, HI0074 family n=1 Tax=Methanosarcina barkeri 3 TaxID=1434107 RepID=A0A0E3SN60_METBA|nr:HI0074 family nucleotidyltransferase substrate-binding subunit [Methanosarcina barkeri]AKB83866.1 nucleotidyltransferase substrate binding protein, HI0074 family [Methanosarcina barkeri 3]